MLRRHALERGKRKAVEISLLRAREASAPGILHRLHTERAQPLHTIILVAFSENRPDKKRVQNEKLPSEKPDKR